MNDISLVILPGLDGTEVLFGPLLANLPTWIKPVVLNYPATGTNSYEELIDWVEQRVASMGKFAVLGSSFGGPLALMLAARRPSQVSAVVLCASFVRPPRPELVRFRSITRTPVIATLRAVRRIRYVIPGFASNDLRRAKAVLWRRVRARVLAARSRAVLGVDVRAQLQQCAAPLMYLAFSRDDVVPRANCDEVKSLAPQTHVVEVEGSHLGLFTNPVPSAAFIAGFLEESTGGAALTPTSAAPGPCESVCQSRCLEPM
jgi:pimeloyl-ACP methyl ester carboxylesterase